MTLSALQSRLRDLVAACPAMDGRPVLIEAKGNLVSDIETALSSVAIAAVIAPASGQVKDASARGRAAWEETFEVIIHRGALSDDSAPSTVALLEELRDAIHGARLSADASAAGLFRCQRHDLREIGDGTYARVLTVTAACV